MTFEEWYTEFNSCCPLDITEEEVALRAWRAGWAEGLQEGYDVGYDDSGICPETLKTQIKTEDGWKELYGEPNTYDWKQEYSHMYWTLKDLLKRSKGATDIAKVVNELEKIHATFPNPIKV